MPRSRIPTGLYAIGWLFLLHGLANVFVGVFRVVDLHRATTDVLAAALPRAQVCLLVIWLVLGTERLSWRLCGLIAGCCFNFMVFSRLLFPRAYGVSQGAGWYPEEWVFYFRLSGPGDWLVRLPVLVAGVAAPLLMLQLWRAVRAVRRDGLPLSKLLSRLRFQFRFQDVAIWTVTICLALAAVYQTAPHERWLNQLLLHCRQFHHFDIAGDLPTKYVLKSAGMQAVVALVSLWAVYSTTRWWIRLPVTIVVVAGPAYVFDRMLDGVVSYARGEDLSSTVWGQASAELLATLLMAATIIVSLSLFRMYETLSRSGGAASEP